MTAYLIFEELEAGNLTLDTLVPISAENAQKSQDAKNYPASVPLPAGSSVPVDTLLKLILVPSASASCIVMAEYISGSEEAFVQRMNETARELGMTAEYENSHGAHVHYLTARSQAILVREFIQRYPQILDYTSLTGVSFNGKWYPNTNKLLPGLDYAYEGADGFKTGTITAAGYCLSATAVKNGRRIISVVMKSSNDRTRHTDSAALLDYGFALLEYQSPYDDVAYHWCREDVAGLKELGVELHAQEDAFRPDDPVTRAEFTAMLYTALEQKEALPQAPEGLEEPDFTDTADSWAADYIHQAAALGLVNGADANSFAPDRPITRQEIMTILDRCLDLPDENGLGLCRRRRHCLLGPGGRCPHHRRRTVPGRQRQRPDAPGHLHPGRGRRCPQPGGGTAVISKENGYDKTCRRSAVRPGPAGWSGRLRRSTAGAFPHALPLSHADPSAHADPRANTYPQCRANPLPFRPGLRNAGTGRHGHPAVGDPSART